MRVEALQRELTKGASDSMTVESGEIGNAAVDVARQEYLTLYNTRARREVSVLPSMLKAKLSLKWRSEHDVPVELIGRNVWSEFEVEFPPEGETYVCELHIDHPDRYRADAQGITTVCRREGIPNLWSLKRHMEVKHSIETQALRAAERDEREAEARAEQTAYLEALKTVSDKGITKDDLKELVLAIRDTGKDGKE